MSAAKPPVVPAAQWQEALEELQQQESEVARAIDALAAARKRMPMTPVERDYAFDGPDGEVSLADLFEGRSQLVLYRFFFEEGVAGWPDAGCVGCSSWADGVGDLGLVHARDITLAMVSPAPRPALQAYAERMGWQHIPWYTIRSESFTEDFGASEWFALNVLLRDGDAIYRTTYLQQPTLVSNTGNVTGLMNLTPYGGQIVTEDVPEGWPQEEFAYWMRRHDEFGDDLPPSARA